MRAFFALSVFLACAWLGGRKRARLTARLSALNAFAADVRRLHDIMELTPVTIAEAASRLKCEVWGRFVASMGSHSAGEAWRRALDETDAFAEDRAVFEGFSDVLRANEMRAQLNALSLLIRELDERKAGLAAELERKGRMYSSLGVLLGLSLALLVI